MDDQMSDILYDAATQTEVLAVRKADWDALMERLTAIEAKASRLERRIIELEFDRDAAPLPADYGKGLPF
jgi:hypothetical protein